MRKIITMVVLFNILSLHQTVLESAETEPSTLVFPPFGHCYGIRKGGERQLWMFLGDKTRFVDPQGLATVKLKANNKPGTQDDDELTVYGVNSGKHQVIYNKSLLSLGIYGKRGNDIGEFRNPKGIAANDDGDVFVADTGNHRIVHLKNVDNELVHVKFIGHNLKYPQQVALSADNHLCISDSGTNQVKVYTTAGDEVNTFPPPIKPTYSFIKPDGIAVITPAERWNRFNDGFFCVVDSSQTRLRQFSLDGNLMARADLAVIPFKSPAFAYIAIDYYGQVWATDTKNHTLHKFDRNLNYITSFGTKGKGDNEFIEPRGIAIWRRFGQVFIAEEKSAQYYWIGIDIENLTVSVQAHEIHLTFRLTEPGQISLALFQGDKLVRRYFENQSFSSGDQSWLESRAGLQSGTYILKIEAKPNYSSAKHFSKIIEKEIVVP